jgi:hypothetical protein
MCYHSMFVVAEQFEQVGRRKLAPYTVRGTLAELYREISGETLPVATPKGLRHDEKAREIRESFESIFGYSGEGRAPPESTAQEHAQGPRRPPLDYSCEDRYAGDGAGAFGHRSGAWRKAILYSPPKRPVDSQQLTRDALSSSSGSACGVDEGYSFRDTPCD